MLWIKSFHIIFVICWFAGLFYLPRLYVYHAMTDDQTSIDRFKIMERKLFYGIMTPSGLLATAFGIWLIALHPSYYLHQGWMHAKLALIALLWVYHGFCFKYLHDFKVDQNAHSHLFYRWFNEGTILLLVGIIILVVVRPWAA